GPGTNRVIPNAGAPPGAQPPYTRMQLTVRLRRHGRSREPAHASYIRPHSPAVRAHESAAWRRGRVQRLVRPACTGPPPPPGRPQRAPILGGVAERTTPHGLLRPGGRLGAA